MTLHWIMPLAEKLKKELELEGIRYRLSNHIRSFSLLQAARQCELLPRHIATAHLLRSQDEFILAIYRLDRELDLARVEALLKRPVEVVDVTTANVFSDCEPYVIPPVPTAYGVKAIWDDALLNLAEVSFISGSQTAMVTVAGDDYRALLQGFPHDVISRPLSDLSTLVFCEPTQPQSVPPVLREVVARFLKYRPEMFLEDEAIHALLLKKIPHTPPRYAQFEAVTHVALGMHAGREFKLPETGPLSQYAFWDHAFSCAFLCKVLAERVGIPSDLAYLAGFLHNFGLLLLSSAFRSEYMLLNKLCMLSPKLPLPALEQKLLCPGSIAEIVGRGHAKMGAWLIHAWHLPQLIETVCEYHHEPVPPAAHAEYVALVALSNAILKQEGIGDASTDVPTYAKTLLALKDSDIEQAHQTFVKKHGEIQQFLSLFLSNQVEAGCLNEAIHFLA